MTSQWKPSLPPARPQVGTLGSRSGRWGHCPYAVPALGSWLSFLCGAVPESLYVTIASHFWHDVFCSHEIKFKDSSRFKLFKSTGQFCSPAPRWWMGYQCLWKAIELFTRQLSESETHGVRPYCGWGNKKFGNGFLSGGCSPPSLSEDQQKI